MLHSLLLVVAGSLATGAAPPIERPPDRVGQIIIIGNEVTAQGVILSRLPLYPGQVLAAADLAAANRSLRRLRLFGITASAQVLDNPLDKNNTYKDILVNVQETPATHLLIFLPHSVVRLAGGPLGLFAPELLSDFAGPSTGHGRKRR